MGLSRNMNIWWGLWTCAAWCCGAAAPCDVTVEDRVYTEETLVTGVRNTEGLAVDHATNTLYFSFYNETRYNAKLDLGNKELTLIDELSGECRFSVDQVRRRMLAGCSTDNGVPGGLYERDSNTGRFELAGEMGKDVSFLIVYNDTVYYSLFGKNSLHTFTKGHSANVSTLTSQVWNWIFDPNGDFLLHNASEVAWQPGTGSTATRRMGYSSWTLALALDGRGAAYTCGMRSADGIWRLHDDVHYATRVLPTFCSALTFDAHDNIIYGDFGRESVVRLVKCSRRPLDLPVPPAGLSPTAT